VQELLERQLNDVEERYAPRMLHVRGDRGLLKQGVRVAVVGSRNISHPGRLRAQRLARILAAEKIIVVSGLARGVDTHSHSATVHHGGRTVAVLGTGIDRAYPPENRRLQELIGREHLLVSQFPPGTPPRRGNFPQRNRTMALLSDATVIIEASEQSGTQSQGWETLRLGRPLFLARSLVEHDDAVSWARKMLDYGGRILSEPEDLLAELPFADYAPEDAVAF
jgi:DNA processing protein